MGEIRCEINFPLLPTLTATDRARHAFSRPLAVHMARRIEEVLPVMRSVEAASAQGHWCVGFVSHEAAPAFDSALVTQTAGGRPLAWFAEFSGPEAHELAGPPPLSGAPVDAANFSLSDWRSDTSGTEFRDRVESIRADILEGRFYQVNFTTRLAAEFKGDALAFHRTLQQEQPNGYQAFIDTGDTQVLSVSPELFFSLREGVVTTQPMKGTAPRGDTPEADERITYDLTHSEKERAENLMIVDLLRNDLSRIAEPHSVEAPSLFTLHALPSVWQMTSTVRATLRAGLGLTDVFRALFPCGSVTGAPKVEAMKAIRDLEGAPRGIYCGAIGFVAPHGVACFNVGIRSVWIEQGLATCGVGSGITFDSTVAGEAAELEYKGRFARRAAKPFELLETIRLEEGRCRLRDRHLARMENSARHFRFDFERAMAAAELNRLETQYPRGVWRIRMLADRAGNMRSEVRSLDAAPLDPVFVIADSPIASQDEFLQHKTTRREVYEAHSARHASAFDVLLWNERDELTEFTRANLVLKRDGLLWTPPTNCGLLNGTLRDELLATGVIRERLLYREDLDHAETIWWVNGLRGWVAIQLSGTAMVRAA
jgi:para-aminobenzoate synthetase/4-amino-4-deoxychorismate lyase